MKNLLLNDRLKAHDGFKGGLRGVVTEGKGLHKIPFVDPFGRISYRLEFDQVNYESENIIPIGGYQFIFDKLFNIGLDDQSPLKVGDLNFEAPQMKIGVNQERYISKYYRWETYLNDDEILQMIIGDLYSSGKYPLSDFNNDEKAQKEAIYAEAKKRAKEIQIGLTSRMADDIHLPKENPLMSDGKTLPTEIPRINISGNNFIFGFMTGDGGSREDNLTAIAPDYKSRTMFRAIPFQIIASGEENNIEAGKYFGISKSAGSTPNTSYYVKKFDQQPQIIHSWVTDEGEEYGIVDDSVFSSTSTMAIESYIEMGMTINASDCRAFFNYTGATPRINEFGLVSGWYNPIEKDYEHLRLFTHYTRPSIALSTGDEIEVRYRLYAR